MKLKCNEFLAIVYGKLFRFPILPDELTFRAIGKNKDIVEFNYICKKKEITLRKKMLESSEIKMLKAREITEFLKFIPTIQAIFLTGSVAALNAGSEADIDIMVITTPGSLWITRMMVVGLLKILGKYRTKTNIRNSFCSNIFLDSENLLIEKQNLFTAHEVILAKCIFDRGGVEGKWIRENAFAQKYLPNMYKKRVVEVIKKENKEINIRGGFVIKLILFPFELISFCLQYLYMRTKITNEEIGLKRAFFHPADLTTEIYRTWAMELAKLGYNENWSKKIFFG